MTDIVERLRLIDEIERQRAEIVGLEAVRKEQAAGRDYWRAEHDKMRAERDALLDARHAELTHVMEQSRMEYDGNTVDKFATLNKLMNLRLWAENRRDSADVLKEARAALRGGEENG